MKDILQALANEYEAPIAFNGFITTTAKRKVKFVQPYCKKGNRWYKLKVGS